jgi:hypothetical protein
MPIGHKSAGIFAGAFLIAALLPVVGQTQSHTDAIGLAEKQISVLLTQLADVHCTETVIQEKLAENGQVLSSEREQFDYLIMIGGHEDDFQLNESRIEAPGWRRTHTSLPMMLTNGMATILLVFHPYYRDGFTFEQQPEEVQGGRATVPIRFAHIQGRRTPAALALRGREYPLDLQGTAWLDKDTGAVVKVDASLLHDMSDVGLRSLDIHVEYKPMKLGSSAAQVMMPASAIVDVMTPRQHWRNTHFFGNYHNFSADAEQDLGVKIHNDPTTTRDTPDSNSLPADPKEKP